MIKPAEPTPSSESAVDDQQSGQQVSSGEERMQTGLTAHRASTRDDVASLMPIAREFHAESRFGHIPFSEEKFFRAYADDLDNNGNIVIYICQNGSPVGVIGGIVGDYFLGQGGRMVTSYVVYVSNQVRGSFLGSKVGVRLVRLLADWARAQKAEELHIHVTAGIAPEQSDRFFRKLGFQAYGGNYVAKVG